MEENTRLSALMPHVRLGVRGLPNLTNGLNPGGLYVLVAETAATRFPLLASSLAATLSDGRRCSVVLPSHPEPFLQRLEALAGSSWHRSLANGQCQLFTPQEELPKRMFRFGIERFVQELEQFNVVDDSFLLFDQADDLISLHDLSLALEQFDVLASWLRRKRVTAMLVFLRLTEANGANLNALMDSLSGVARLGSDPDSEGLRLSFDYWQSPDGAVAARYYTINTLASGHYEASQRSMVDASGMSTVPGAGNFMAPPPPADEPRNYFYMDPDLGSLASLVPGQWHHVDTLVGIMHATRHLRAPIIIFCFRPDTELRQLAEAVHTLRINLGPYAQLVVQEKDASLRYQNEALLLRLGLNLVMHRDVPIQRMPLLLGSLAGQIFNRDVDIDFEAALASVAPAQLKGYQAPQTFVREVQNLIDRSSALNIPFVLAAGLPLIGQSMVDVLSLMRVSRAGDIVTADTRMCYIFLHACQQSVALSALERMVGGPVEEVFEELSFQISHEEIEAALEGLLQNAKSGRALDYSSQLPDMQSQPNRQQYAPMPGAPSMAEPYTPVTVAAPTMPMAGAAPSPWKTGSPLAGGFAPPEPAQHAGNPWGAMNPVNASAPGALPAMPTANSIPGWTAPAAPATPAAPRPQAAAPASPSGTRDERPRAQRAGAVRATRS